MRAGFTRGAIYGHFRNKGQELGFVAMTNRVHVADGDAGRQQRSMPGRPDPLGRIRQLLVFCLGKAVVEPHSRRVFEVLFTKCEAAHATWISCSIESATPPATEGGSSSLLCGNAIARGNCRLSWIRFARQASCMRSSAECCETGCWSRIRSYCRAMLSIWRMRASACCGIRLRVAGEGVRMYLAPNDLAQLGVENAGAPVIRFS